jgi:hypothetical protein
MLGLPVSSYAFDGQLAGDSREQLRSFLGRERLDVLLIDRGCPGRTHQLTSPSFEFYRQATLLDANGANFQGTIP